MLYVESADRGAIFEECVQFVFRWHKPIPVAVRLAVIGALRIPSFEISTHF